MTPGVLGNAAVLPGEEPPIERDVMTGRSELRLNLYPGYGFVKRGYRVPRGSSSATAYRRKSRIAFPFRMRSRSTVGSLN
jgi:hypothetical protein